MVIARIGDEVAQRRHRQAVLDRPRPLQRRRLHELVEFESRCHLADITPPSAKVHAGGRTTASRGGARSRRG